MWGAGSSLGKGAEGYERNIFSPIIDKEKEENLLGAAAWLARKVSTAAYVL